MGNGVNRRKFVKLLAASGLLLASPRKPNFLIEMASVEGLPSYRKPAYNRATETTLKLLALSELLREHSYKGSSETAEGQTLAKPSPLFPDLPVIPPSTAEHGQTGLYNLSPLNDIDYYKNERLYQINHEVEGIEYVIGQDRIPENGITREIEVIGRTTEDLTITLYPANNVTRIGDYREDLSRRIEGSEEERDHIARVLVVEAGGDGIALYNGGYIKGLVAVINTMLNRYGSERWNPNHDPIIRVVRRPYQYAWPGQFPSPYFEELTKEIVNLALEGKLADVTNGANSFYAPRWSRGFRMSDTVRIGGHLFGKQ